MHDFVAKRRDTKLIAGYLVFDMVQENTTHHLERSQVQWQRKMKKKMFLTYHRSNPMSLLRMRASVIEDNGRAHNVALLNMKGNSLDDCATELKRQLHGIYYKTYNIRLHDHETPWNHWWTTKMAAMAVTFKYVLEKPLVFKTRAFWWDIWYPIAHTMFRSHWTPFRTNTRYFPDNYVGSHASAISQYGKVITKLVVPCRMTSAFTSACPLFKFKRPFQNKCKNMLKARAQITNTSHFISLVTCRWFVSIKVSLATIYSSCVCAHDEKSNNIVYFETRNLNILYCTFWMQPKQ